MVKKNSATLLITTVMLTSALAEHSGAYSSPQYAKKMYPKIVYDTNSLLPNEMSPVSFKRHYGSEIDRSDNETSQYGRSSLLSSASNFLSSSGGQMVKDLARDFIARSTGSSQVGLQCVSQVRIAPSMITLHALCK